MEQRLKIAVFHNLPSGGAKRALYDHVKYLINSGNIVDVFIPSTANEEYLPLKEIATHVKVYPVHKNISSFLLSFMRYRLPVGELSNLDNAQKLIADEINGGDYDVVFCEQDQYSMTPFILKYIKKPFVYYCQQPLRHDEAILKKIAKNKSGIKDSLKGLVYRYIDNRFVAIDKKLAESAKYTLANSYFSRESILKTYGINSYVCYLGINTELFKPVEVLKKNMVLSVGSYISMKGHDFIIKSLAYIDPGIRPKFVLIANNGDNDWKQYLEELAESLDVDMEILTLIDDDRLVELYNQAQLILYSPHLEPFGLVPLESMACGTPVVAVKEGGVRETVIHNKTGLLTERDEELFSSAVKELLQDENKRYEYSKNSVELVRNYWTLAEAGKRLDWHLKRAKNSK
ncbi:glycosyl transferase [Methanobacterium subterraneum]|uniref:Glycosyl transferase n=1 Tax=Methanobacterium subterraneum TaxID=59277 RepID=A0A2H4VNK8_9EURY|nr:glycosyltransferase family 4 protein [Methanobacterium subterraneum]AUB59679.1 glycosyl transferase [Methanobacterium subterraneum]